MTNLVLGRREGEKILIGPKPYQVEMVVTRIYGNHVSLMFTADKDVPIDRWERAVKKGLLD